MLSFQHPLTFSFLFFFFFLTRRLFQTCKKKKKNRKKKKLPQVTSIYLNLHSSPQNRKRLNGTFFLLLLSLAYVAKPHKTQRCTLMYNWQRSPLRDWLPFFFLLWLLRRCNFCSPSEEKKKKIARLFVNQEPFVNDGGVDVEFGSSHWPD